MLSLNPPFFSVAAARGAEVARWGQLKAVVVVVAVAGWQCDAEMRSGAGSCSRCWAADNGAGGESCGGW